MRPTIFIPPHQLQHPTLAAPDLQVPVRLVNGVGTLAVTFELSAPPGLFDVVKVDDQAAVAAGGTVLAHSPETGTVVVAVSFTTPVSNPRQPLVVAHFASAAVGKGFIGVTLCQVDETFLPSADLPFMAVEVCDA